MSTRLDDCVRDWITANIGPVHSIERQHRWRPAWFVCAEQQGRPIRLYVRGDREGFGFMGVRREGAILREMEAHGIPVPHIYGEVDAGQDGEAVVMDWLQGEPNLASAHDTGEVDDVMNSYVDALVRTHRIEPEAFAGLGLTAPDTPEAIALGYFSEFVTRYREFKQHPEPLLEFAIGWLHRNVPRHRGKARFVVGDCGQFMFADRGVTGLLDMELAHIGDISHDLAGLRLRNVTEPMGDLGRVLRRYEAVSREPLDPAAIEFHTAKFALCTPLGLVIVLHLNLPLPEILQYIEWFQQLSLHAIESIARQADVSLDPVLLPDPDPIGYSGVAAGLPAMIESLSVPEGMAKYQRDTVASVARFCARVCEFDAAITAADLDDITPLVGFRPVDSQAGAAALEDFIVGAGPQHDAALIRLLHRRTMRQLLLLEPVLSAPGGIGHVAPLPELLNR